LVAGSGGDAGGLQLGFDPSYKVCLFTVEFVLDVAMC